MLVDLTGEAGISLSRRRGFNSREGNLETKFDVHSCDKSAEILFLMLWGSGMIHVGVRNVEHRSPHSTQEKESILVCWSVGRKMK